MRAYDQNYKIQMSKTYSFILLAPISNVPFSYYLRKIRRNVFIFMEPLIYQSCAVFF